MANEVSAKPASQGRTKFFVGGAIIIAAILYLIVTSTQASAQYFLTVKELEAKGSEVVGRDVRISGAVIGDTILNDTASLTLTFTIAHIPGDNNEIEEMGGLANVLHDATLDPMLPRLQVIYSGVKPDLLKNEAQAIMTGKLAEDGIFYADELLLKCPTKYEEAVPEQIVE
ncbi:MAG: cytochrome c maturation protein CcmE [Anaerolineaceae bacterium]|nr:cytochrome c maturation protein CcmE [Anaerolineaceae bacterium]